MKKKLCGMAMAALFSCAVLFAAGAAVTPVHAASLPGPYVTFLFSRAEEGAAVSCQPSDGGGVLTGTVAPLMQAQGLVATGTVNTLATGNTEGCTHSNESLTSSWGDLATLSGYGWTFVPHEYDGPVKVAKLTPSQQWDVTCGQVPTLQAHSLTGATGMVAYPGNQQNNPAITALQQNYGENCFDFGRKYSQVKAGVTTQAQGTTAPYTEYAEVLKGGPGTGSPAYTSPATVITQMQALQPGQWLTIQMYLLVQGTSPPGDAITWDCNSPIHTSNDVERYCLNDAEQVFTAAAAMQTAGLVTVTDPASVAAAWGRAAPGMTRP
jgi:hypothetical protein